MNLTNQFLISMPGLLDPNFHKSVTYICQHNEQGCMGITINHPLTINLGEMFDQLNIELLDKTLASTPIYSGGPVDIHQGFVLHSSDKTWQYSLPINDEITLSSSSDVLDAIARGTGPEYFLIALGYSGWTQGQLEREIVENSWITCPANTDILFQMHYSKRWQASAEQLGFDINLISTETGHA